MLEPLRRSWSEDHPCASCPGLEKGIPVSLSPCAPASLGSRRQGEFHPWSGPQALTQQGQQGQPPPAPLKASRATASPGSSSKQSLKCKGHLLSPAGLQINLTPWPSAKSHQLEDITD